MEEYYPEVIPQQTIDDKILLKLIRYDETIKELNESLVTDENADKAKNLKILKLQAQYECNFKKTR